MGAVCHPRSERSQKSTPYKMKLLFLVLAFAVLSTEVMSRPQFNLGSLLNPTRGGLKDHAKNKIIGGAILSAAGAFTGNRGLSNAGNGLIGLGAGTAVAAHFFPNNGR